MARKNPTQKMYKVTSPDLNLQGEMSGKLDRPMYPSHKPTGPGVDEYATTDFLGGSTGIVKVPRKKKVK